MTHPFTDVPDDAFYADAVEWGWENGVTTGTSPTTFSPDGLMTRGEGITFQYRAWLLDNPEVPIEPPVVVPPEPEPGRPLVLTLDETNTGTGGTFDGDGLYTMHITEPGSYFDVHVIGGTTGKAVFMASTGEVHIYNALIQGGEDGISQNNGDLYLHECIVENVAFPPGSHSDAYQATSGGAGGTLIAYDTLFTAAFRMSNAALQLNVGQGAELYRCGFSGGAYSAFKDDRYTGYVELVDCLFGWGTSQFGPIGGNVTHTGSVWWDPREMRPRTGQEAWNFDPELTHDNRGGELPAVAPGGVYAGPPNGTPI